MKISLEVIFQVTEMIVIWTFKIENGLIFEYRYLNSKTS